MQNYSSPDPVIHATPHAPPHAIVTATRRIDRLTRILQLGACVCAGFSAVGIALGLHEANPAGGWAVPAVAGAVAALMFAALWHAMIGASIRVVRLSTSIALFIGAVVITLIALGASAQAIATVVAGRAALGAELAHRIDSYAEAASDAYAEATGWRAIAESAQVLGQGYAKQAELEDRGSHGSGRGQGPKWASLTEASESFLAGADALRTLLAQASDEQTAAAAQLALMRDAASRGDQEQFMAAAGQIGVIIGHLDAIDPRPVVESTGMIRVTARGINLSEDTAKWEADADHALKDREQIKAPVFVPMSLGEATRAQLFGAALHGWVLAGAIDVLPLLALVLIFVLSREAALYETVEQTRLTPAGRRARDLERYATMQGKNATANVTSIREAAE